MELNRRARLGGMAEEEVEEAEDGAGLALGMAGGRLGGIQEYVKSTSTVNRFAVMTTQLWRVRVSQVLWMDGWI